MAVLLVSEYGKDPKEWGERLGRGIPGLELRGWPEVGDPASIEVILTDALLSTRGGFGLYPRLRWVHYLGHGVGDVLRDPSLAPSVMVTRQKRAAMANSLAIYVVQAIAADHLRCAEYREQQRRRVWQRLPSAAPSTLKVVVLGQGIIGVTIARRLRDFGYTVYGWSRSGREEEGVRAIAGMEALRAMLPEAHYVVGALPETDATVGLVNRHTLDLMKPGAYLVNIGRGSLMVEPDVLEALDAGRLSGVALDVFATEPLPADHPFWDHPKVTITPHGGGPAKDDVEQVFEDIIENYRRLVDGKPLLDLADRALGY